MPDLLTPRRRFLKVLGAAASASISAGAPAAAAREVEQWGVFEIQLNGPDSNNSFLEITLGAEFRYQHRSVNIAGFYDGGGIYKIRFMPDTIGEWSYATVSNHAALSSQTSVFHCTAASIGNHGPVQISNTYHFSYADGTPYRPFGTTCYAWVHQGDELEEQTLSTLRSSPFNKLRMCIFPKSYVYNENEPRFYPFSRSSDGTNNFAEFNPAFFQHLEKRIEQLRELRIEADLILFHPYDRWGYSKMPPEVDDRYLRYVVARFSAYRNVWWSLANEFDLMKDKKLSDWDHFFRIVQASDPYAHLRSIHHSKVMYDHAKPWVTHVSIQDDNFGKTADLRNQFLKPVVYDECKYEGNIPRRWGNISSREMVRRFWLGMTAGAYVGHGETYLDPHDILWWSKGGALHGESPRRIAFLRKLVDQAPVEGLNPTSDYYQSAGQSGRYYLYYFDLHQPREYVFDLGKDTTYKADWIDPWEMTITPIAGTFSGKFSLSLPGRPYLAVRLQKL